MSAPKFNHYHIDLDTMQVTHVGRTNHEDVLKHPVGIMFVIMDGATWARSDKHPVWEKIKDGKTNEITIATQAED